MILINGINFFVLIITRGRLLRHYTGYNIFDFSQVPYITLNVVTYKPTDLSYIINTFKYYIISFRVTVHIIVSPCLRFRFDRLIARSHLTSIMTSIHLRATEPFEWPFFFSIFVFSTYILLLIIQKHSTRDRPCFECTLYTYKSLGSFVKSRRFWPILILLLYYSALFSFLARYFTI